MKLSVLTFSFQLERLTGTMNAERLCNLALENGLDQVDLMISEIRLYGAGALKRAFRKTGVACGCVIAHLPFFRGVDKYPAKLEEAFSLCRELDCLNLMIVPGDGDRRECALLSREEMLRRGAELYTMAVNRASQRGIQVLFEDTPQDYKPFSSAADCRRLLDDVPGLGFVFDTANFMVAEENFDLMADYELLKDRIRRVHLKDVVRGPFPSGERCENGDAIRCVATGSGTVNLRDLVQRLRSDGYEGALSIEYAAGRGVRGTDHSKYLSVYVKVLAVIWRGRSLRRPTAP